MSATTENQPAKQKPTCKCAELSKSTPDRRYGTFRCVCGTYWKIEVWEKWERVSRETYLCTMLNWLTEGPFPLCGPEAAQQRDELIAAEDARYQRYINGEE